MADEPDLAKSIEETLRAVIETLIDCEEGFRLIGQDLKDESLKTSFLAEAQTRAAFRRTLEETLHQIGVADATETGTVVGAIHRSWGDIKAKLGSTDRDLLETACQGEESALQIYKLALDKKLLLPIRQVLVNQQAHVQETLEYLQVAAEGLV
ncbi:hypothetical protein ACPOL_3406 [Acidisarcina polymorpha]|uniref:DUF2383 domain-containing protein n=1 Tax=Acidisarcina polymorpha TaxID=2211140 RepID=A0A2Z5G0J7_9BACT|nr:PA2169 family four-helix-bundle protein [Acidisarcina polymorpha]AXC12693.1 hypothetical protein ACPOL_3406 [Acidisarcina polymorpha]